MEENYSKKAIEQLLKRRPKLQLLDNLLQFHYPHGIYDNTKISKYYLDPTEVKNFEQLDEEISIKELYDLNKEYDNKLKWRLLNSSVTDEEILAFEKKLNIKIPKVLKDYFQSYALPLEFVYGRISGEECRFTYCEDDDSISDREEDDEIATTKFELCPMLYQHELTAFEECIGMYDDTTGYINIGGYNEYHYFLLDIESGKIIQLDHESGAQTREEIQEEAYDFFDSFEDLLKCYFFGETYDIDEQTFIEE